MLEFSSIKEILQQKTIENIFRADSKFAFLDREIYRSRLNKTWAYNHTSTAKGLVTSLITDIATISLALDQISGEDERTARDILCHYLLTYGHIMRDQQQYAEAITALEEVVKIAECVNNNQLLAVALLRLGNVYHDRGDIALVQSKIDTASGDSAGTNLLWAQAYADIGKLDGAALLAQDALMAMKRIKSEVNIARIHGLYKQLVSKDSSQIEVIRLGVLLG